MTTKGTDNRFRSLTVVGEAGTPSTPGTGDFKLYVADDGTFYVMDDTGTPTALGGGGLSDPMTTRGDIIVRNASNVTARLGIGSAGTVLTSDGTDVAWSAPAGSSSGLSAVLEQHTASGSATLDFTTFISSTYDQYLFQLINIVPATDDTQLRVRVGTGAGPTYDTGTSYAWALRIDRSGGTATNGADSGQAFIGLVYQAGGTLGIDSANTMGWCGNLYLFDPQNTGIHKRFLGDGTYFDNEPFSMRTTVQGAYLSTTAVTAVRFYMDTGNIATGTIRVYGVTK